MSSNATVTPVIAAVVAFVAGGVEGVVRLSTGLGVEYLDLGMESVSLLAIGANFGSVLVTPIAVFAVGYLLVRDADPGRSYAVLTAVLFLGAAVGSVAVQFALSQSLSIAHYSLTHTILGYLELAVSTGLAVTVAGLAGVGAAVLFDADARRDRRPVRRR
ncbi:hypothetical protein [Natronobeatus ordinarius]|uniref:hypothetical protein n=1 Tax=Natronobeatus ordinarius TaxID=2963433 RepID=UPI0020CE5137|nr:hypothetical protein [Natronobeatus ordinarius]